MQEALSRVPGRSPRSSPAERRMAWAANQTQPPETRRRRRRRLGRPRRDGRVGRPAGNLLLSAPLTWTRLGRRLLHWLVKGRRRGRAPRGRSCRGHEHEESLSPPARVWLTRLADPRVWRCRIRRCSALFGFPSGEERPTEPLSGSAAVWPPSLVGHLPPEESVGNRCNWMPNEPAESKAQENMSKLGRKP